MPVGKRRIWLVCAAALVAENSGALYPYLVVNLPGSQPDRFNYTTIRPCLNTTTLDGYNCVACAFWSCRASSWMRRSCACIWSIRSASWLMLSKLATRKPTPVPTKIPDKNSVITSPQNGAGVWPNCRYGSAASLLIFTVRWPRRSDHSTIAPNKSRRGTQPASVMSASHSSELISRPHVL